MQFRILYSDIFFLANIPYFNFQINFLSSHLTKKETEDASKRLSSYCMGALNCFDSCSLDVLMCSYVHAHMYPTSICDLFLFLSAKWSQFLVTIFIQAQLLYLYSFDVLYSSLRFDYRKTSSSSSTQQHAPLHKPYVLSWIYLLNHYSDMMDSNGVPIPKNPKCFFCHRFGKKISGKMKVAQTKNGEWLKLVYNWE